MSLRSTLNLAAILGSSAAPAILPLVIAPHVARILGDGPYGFLAFLVTLQATYRLFDLGCAIGITKTLSAGQPPPNDAEGTKTFLSTFEILFLAMAGLVTALVAANADRLLHGWLPRNDAASARSLILMACVCALSFVNLFSSSALLGFHRQLPVALFRLAEATVGYVGGLLAIAFISPTVDAYLSVQVAAAAVFYILAKVILWRHTGYLVPRRFALAAVRHIAPFAAGMFAISIATFVLTSFDGVLLSHTLDGAEFGYFRFASMIFAGIAPILIAPMFNVFFPRISAAAGRGDSAAVADSFHLFSQLMTTVLVSACATIAIFAEPIVGVWLRDSAAVPTVAAVARVAVIGTALNGLLNSAYAVQLSYGKTRAPLACNLAAGATALVLDLMLIPTYGSMGAATTWCLSMAVYLVVSTALTWRLLPAEIVPWLVKDTLIPGGAAVAAVFACSQLPLGHLEGFGRLLAPTLGGLAGLAAATVVSPKILRAIRL